jgi:hypothetical protein
LRRQEALNQERDLREIKPVQKRISQKSVAAGRQVSNTAISGDLVKNYLKKIPADVSKWRQIYHPMLASVPALKEGFLYSRYSACRFTATQFKLY